MKRSLNPVLAILMLLNSVVLLGQLWPEGAPPFARVVNIIALAGNLTFFIFLLKQKKQ